jgi:hypothetical protein
VRACSCGVCGAPPSALVPVRGGARVRCCGPFWLVWAGVSPARGCVSAFGMLSAPGCAAAGSVCRLLFFFGFAALFSFFRCVVAPRAAGLCGVRWLLLAPRPPAAPWALGGGVLCVSCGGGAVAVARGLLVLRGRFGFVFVCWVYAPF